jgi:hypothetical protein
VPGGILPQQPGGASAPQVRHCRRAVLRPGRFDPSPSRGTLPCRPMRSTAGLLGRLPLTGLGRAGYVPTGDRTGRSPRGAQSRVRTLLLQIHLGCTSQLKFNPRHSSVEPQRAPEHRPPRSRALPMTLDRELPALLSTRNRPRTAVTAVKGMRSRTAVRRPSRKQPPLKEDHREAFSQVNPDVVGLAGLEPAASS